MKGALYATYKRLTCEKCLFTYPEEELRKPPFCAWCGSETTELKPYWAQRVYHYGRKDAEEKGVWWLSPCCVHDIKSLETTTYELTEIEQ
jgi:hypothetical protein